MSSAHAVSGFFLISLLTLLVTAPASAVAPEPKTPPATVTRIGTEIQGIKSTSALGVLFGWRYLHHESDTFAVGGAAYTGQLSGSNTGSFSYGGLVVSYGGYMSSKVTGEFYILAGGAGGFTGTSPSSGGVALAPNLSLGLIFGKTVRTGLTAGYIWIPSATAFSGITGGLRFDFLVGPDT